MYNEGGEKMTETQIERFEGMLTQLVSMVGSLKEDIDTIKNDVSNLKTEVSNIKTEVNNIKTEMNIMKTDINNLKADMKHMEEKQEKRHAEIIGQLELLRIDQQITWAKTSENEMDIERLKKNILNT